MFQIFYGTTYCLWVIKSATGAKCHPKPPVGSPITPRVHFRTDTGLPIQEKKNPVFYVLYMKVKPNHFRFFVLRNSLKWRKKIPLRFGTVPSGSCRMMWIQITIKRPQQWVDITMKHSGQRSQGHLCSLSMLRCSASIDFTIFCWPRSWRNAFSNQLLILFNSMGKKINECKFRV